jgi:hypothetical protein
MAKDKRLPLSVSAAKDTLLSPLGNTASGKALPPTPGARDAIVETVRCLRRFMFKFGFFQDKGLATEYNKLVDIHELGETYKLEHVDKIATKYVEQDEEVLPRREPYGKFERNFTGLVNFLSDDKPTTNEVQKHERNVRAMRRLIEEEISMQQQAVLASGHKKRQGGASGDKEDAQE